MAADYKQKYFNLRSKFMESIDTSFRLGYEQGAKDAGNQFMQQQMQQQMQQMAMMEQQMANQAQGAPGGPEGGQPSPEEQAAMEAMAQQQGAPGQEGQQPSPEEMEAMMAAMQQEPAANPEMASELDAKIQELESLVAKGEKPSILSMREAVDGLSALRKSQKEKMSASMRENSSSQKKFVDNILKKWEQESKDTSSDIETILKQHDIKTED